MYKDQKSPCSQQSMSDIFLKAFKVFLSDYENLKF